VCSVSEWVHYGCHIIRNTVVKLYNVALGNTKILGKCAVAINTNANAIFANMLQSAAAVTTVAASNVALACYTVANFDVAYTGTNLGNNAYILVTDGHGSLDGLLAPFVPLVDVEVGAADGSLLNLDEDIVHAYFGHGNFFHPNALHGLFLY
jgi:hypothetical protein